MRSRHSYRLHLGLIAVFCLISSVATLLVYRHFKQTQDVIFGATISSVYADELGVDVFDVYQTLLDSGLRNVRIPIYWSKTEQAQGFYDWSVPDRLLDLSAKYGAHVTLVVGQKVPRWPECFIPDWVSDSSRPEALKNFIRVSMNRYNDRVEVTRWQIENEPFLQFFGECPPFDPGLFTEEIDLARSLTKKPIQVTASGEMSTWVPEALLGDMVGTSLYRETWNPNFGYVFYPFSPAFYSIKKLAILGVPLVVSELQAEPWFFTGWRNRTLNDWYESFSEKDLKNNIDFARRTGIKEVYLWGAEWWYLLAKSGDDRLLRTAQEVWLESK